MTNKKEPQLPNLPVSAWASENPDPKTDDRRKQIKDDIDSGKIGGLR